MKNRNKIFTVVSIIVICIGITFLLCGCEEHTTGNRVTYGKDVQTFNYAYIKLDGQEIASGYVTQWRDYDDSDVVQVLIGGKYYLTHYANVVLIADPEMGTIGYDSGLVDHN